MRMRLAVFTSQFPGRVNTFFARDMRALLDAGFEIDIFPLHPLDPAMWRFVPAILSPAVLPRERVHHLAASRFGGHARPRPARVARLLRDGARIVSESALHGPAVAAKSAYALTAAWRWATRGPRERFDHVLAYWGNYAATAAYAFRQLAAPEVPLSIVLHAGTDLYRQRVFFRRKLRAAARLFVVCEFNRTFLEQQYPDLYPEIAGKVAVHHLGLDLDAFTCRLDRATAAPVVGVGSFEAAKGFDDLVRAAGCLQRRDLPVPIRLIGAGPQLRHLEQLRRTEGVEHLVRIEEWQPPEAVHHAIAEAFALVHPSKRLGDAVPTVIKEAMALGTPVVASAIAGIPELLDGGRCGVLVPPASPERIADALAAFIGDESRRRALAGAARAHAERLFDIKRTGAAWASSLCAVTAPARSAHIDGSI